jgi:hypothetical protein
MAHAKIKLTYFLVAKFNYVMLRNEASYHGCASQVY